MNENKKILIIDETMGLGEFAKESLSHKEFVGIRLYLRFKAFCQENNIELNFKFLLCEIIPILLLNQYSYDLIIISRDFSNSSFQSPEIINAIRKFSNIPILIISESRDLNEKGVKAGANNSAFIINDPYDDYDYFEEIFIQTKETLNLNETN